MNGLDDRPDNVAGMVREALFEPAGASRPPPAGRAMARRIEALKSSRGGWSRAALASLGVPWPPPKGWRKALIEGRPLDALPSSSRRRPPPSAHDLPAFRRLLIRHAVQHHLSALYSEKDLDALAAAIAREAPGSPPLLIRWRPPYLTAFWKEGDLNLSLGVHRPG